MFVVKNVNQGCSQYVSLAFRSGIGTEIGCLGPHIISLPTHLYDNTIKTRKKTSHIIGSNWYYTCTPAINKTEIKTLISYSMPAESYAS